MFGLEVLQKSIIETDHPFNKKYIKSIKFNMYKYDDGDIEFYSYIRFTKQGLEGQKRIEGKNFEEIINKTDKYIQSLQD